MKLLPLPDGRLQLVSIVKQKVQFGNEVLDSITSPRNLLIATISAEGTVDEFKLLSTSLEYVDAIVGAKDGGLIIAGRVDEFNLHLGPRSVRTTSAPAYAVAKLSPQAEVQWLAPLSAELSWVRTGPVYGLLEDRDGNVVMTASPGGVNISITGRGCLEEPVFFHLAKFSGANGERLWLQRVASPGFGFVSGIAESPTGDFYLVGAAAGLFADATGQFDQVNNGNCNNTRGFLLRTDATGNTYDFDVFEDRFIPQAVHFSPDGSYLLGGGFAGSVTTLEDVPKPLYALKYYDRYDGLVSDYQFGDDRSASSVTWLSVSPGVNNTIYVSGEYREWDMGWGYRPEIGAELTKYQFIAKMTLLPAPDVSDKEASIADVSVYPNPASDLVNVATPGGATDDWTINLYDIAGRQVDNYRVLRSRSQRQVDISQLPIGAYVLILNSGSERLVHKILKF
ncbi:T9SS type A sorting domain-containing protein [Neolewinella antarctica]|uniref:Secretion system C-terminal sorting domain-containing protein n=1 Tax=Neolewinella antarctica TaxID=442734 RepID=A0ABX0XEN3_9BACT|nr:T9SS type A sorting domain-containing protein [Neolewinella antarctica]NJC27667.1 hypothetical protein [Neolewinella antarctica]